MSLRGKNILVGISGGIAAYKIPELIRQLRKAGANVKVTTTKNALEFVTSLTLQTLSGHPVYSDVFAAINEHSTEHISLPDWADMMIIAPATANILCKLAHGIADDALTTAVGSDGGHAVDEERIRLGDGTGGDDHQLIDVGHGGAGKGVFTGQDLLHEALAVSQFPHFHQIAHQRADALLAELTAGAAGQHFAAGIHIVKAAECFLNSSFSHTAPLYSKLT